MAGQQNRHRVVMSRIDVEPDCTLTRRDAFVHPGKDFELVRLDRRSKRNERSKKIANTRVVHRQDPSTCILQHIRRARGPTQQYFARFRARNFSREFSLRR